MVATILIRLRAAIDSVEEVCAKVRFVFAFLRFDFCDARIASPRRRVRLLGQPDPDAFPVECLSPICEPLWHGFEPERLRGLVNQS